MGLNYVGSRNIEGQWTVWYIFTEKCFWGFFFSSLIWWENEDKWMLFCPLMQQQGIIIVKMQLLDTLPLFYFFFIYSIISACPTFTQPTHRRYVHKSRLCMETSSCQLSRLSVQGLVQTRWSYLRLWEESQIRQVERGCTTKGKNEMPLKAGECINKTNWLSIMMQYLISPLK